MSSYSLCFESDAMYVDYNNSIKENYSSGASSDNTTPNKDAFTISNIFNLRTRIIPTSMIETLQHNYTITNPNSKLWLYDIDVVNTDFENLVCLILFINGVYGIHYVCNTNNYTITQQKQHILETVIPQFKLYSQTNEECDFNFEYTLLINTFDSDGKTKTSTYDIS